jgi:hypothetical protein
MKYFFFFVNVMKKVLKISVGYSFIFLLLPSLCAHNRYFYRLYIICNTTLKEY